MAGVSFLRRWVQTSGDQLERQAARSGGELGIAVATSIVVAVYSARGAARALIAELNRAYAELERHAGAPAPDRSMY